MWSGPRNISTAMMRSFGNRPDCVVVDEPFYSSYLRRSGADHPMRSAILASQPQSAGQVVAQLQAPVSKPYQYQKHMTHHMALPLDEGWLRSLRHAFLIRHPADMVASYLNKRQTVVPEDVGSAQQVQIFEAVCEATGSAPPVIDATRFLADPRRGLEALCSRLEIPFSEAMLEWPRGVRDSDGVWASHWYNSVAQSTSFGRYRAHAELPEDAVQRVVNVCLPHYEQLLAHAL